MTARCIAAGLYGADNLNKLKGNFTGFFLFQRDDILSVTFITLQTAVYWPAVQRETTQLEQSLPSQWASIVHYKQSSLS